MKKTLLITLVSLSAFVFAAVSFAETHYKSGGATYCLIEGKIISVDKAKDFFVVQDKDTKERTTVKAYDDVIASLNEGDNVGVTLAVGSNLALKVTK